MSYSKSTMLLILHQESRQRNRIVRRSEYYPATGCLNANHTGVNILCASVFSVNSALGSAQSPQRPADHYPIAVSTFLIFLTF